MRAFPQVVEEYRPDGTTITLAAAPVARTADGVTAFPHADELGSVRATTDGSGAVTGTASYDAFGQVRARRPAQPHGFTGEPQDADGLVYLRNRWMDPSTGRFLSADPAPGDPRDPRSLHDYVYAYGDPVNLTDPSGLSPTLTEFSIAFALTGALFAIGQGLVGAFAPGERVDWSGPTVDFGFEALQLDFGVGLTVFTATNRGHRTDATHLILTVGASVGLLDGVKARNQPPPQNPNARRGYTLGSAAKRYGAALLSAGIEILPLDFEVGDGTANAPASFGGRNGLEPRVLNGGYLKAGLSVGLGLPGSAIVTAATRGSSQKNTFGGSIFIQGFGAGYSVPDTSLGINTSFDAGMSAGFSIDLTPRSLVNQPAP